MNSAPARRAKLSASKLRLILAAEKIFAAHGINGASLREIALAAGHRNTAAVQYHFDNKERLALAVFSYRVAQMEAPRAAMLQAAEAAGKLSDVRTLLEVLCRPHIDIVDDEGMHSYARFNAHYITQNQPMGMPNISDYPDATRDEYLSLSIQPEDFRAEFIAISQHSRRTLGLIARSLDYLPAEVVTSRIMLCSLIFLNTLVRWDHRAERGADPALFEELIDDAMGMATAALCAVPPHLRQEKA